MRNLTKKKIYSVDCGLANSVLYAFSENAGWCLENAVYVEMRRRGYSVFYHAGKNECDYVCIRGKTKTAVQVTASLSGGNREREVAGLIEAMENNRIRKGLIITLDEKETIREKGFEIPVKAAWEWMLEDDEDDLN